MKILLVALVMVSALLGGCRASGPTTLTIQGRQYEAAFDAAKDEIRKLGFELQRVDARGGVIATAPESTAGLATPWTTTEVTLSAEAQSFMHRDQRRVAVFFDPVDVGGAGAAGPDDVDRRAVDSAMMVRVLATREILHRPGLRLSTAATRLSSVTTDGAGQEGAGSGAIVRDAGEDEALSRLLAKRIARRLNAMERSQDG